MILCKQQQSFFWRTARFCTVGGIAATFNFGALYLLIEFMGLGSSPLQENIANGLAMIVGVTTAFLLHRAWTWGDAVMRSGLALVKQFGSFVASAGLGMLLRVGLFAFCQYYFTIPYLINAAIGMLAAAIVDFLLYDRFVFKKKPKYGA